MASRTIIVEVAEGKHLLKREICNKEMNFKYVGTKSIFFELAEEENEVSEEVGKYFVDDQGNYYFQPAAGTQADLQEILKDAGQGGEPVMLEEKKELGLASEGALQTVTVVPAEAGGEVTYFIIVQQAEHGSGDEKQETHEPFQTKNVYSYDVKKEMKCVVDSDAEGKTSRTQRPFATKNVYEFNEREETQCVVDSDDAEDDNSNTEEVPVKKEPVLKHKCTYCDYVTPRRYLLSRHMRSHSDSRPHTCSVCERGFKTVASLQNHVRTHTGVKPYLCKYCHSAFTTSGELVRHVRYKHTFEKPYACTECDYASVELSKLKRHVRCHTGERPYQCQHCTYASLDTFKLKRHLRTHTGEKPYECQLCHARFTQSNSLKAHALIHNIAAKPVHRCELCPTTCGRKTDLRIHMQKIHTATHPLRCKKCGGYFPDRYSYKLHYQTHAGEKCYKCHLCSYSSVAERHLSTHMLTHTDEKPFTCGLCFQSFRQKQLLRRHINLYHDNDYKRPEPRQKNHECRECGRRYAHRGNLLRHLAVHGLVASGVDDKQLLGGEWEFVEC